MAEIVGALNLREPRTVRYITLKFIAHSMILITIGVQFSRTVVRFATFIVLAS